MKNLKKNESKWRGAAWEKISEKPIWRIFVFNLTDTIEDVYVRRRLQIQIHKLMYNKWSCIR